jgi:chorismate mutase
VGITKLCAIHRGFSVYGHLHYRNPPQWQIPIELHRKIPNLPILTDPSHICGNREYLKEICQQALDLNFTGLMIEAHIAPDKSLSDTEQQITPENLKELLNSLIIRNEGFEGKTNTELESYRKQIDLIDYQIIDLLKNRMDISEIIGKYKRENNITIFQSGRYEELMENRIKSALYAAIDPKFISNIFKTIHEASVNKQNDVMNYE